MLIIPAIDILDGRVVRLKKGDYNSATVYGDSPIEQAKVYNDYGFSWIHIVDLSGSKDGRTTTKQYIEEIKKSTKLKIEFGGGIRTSVDVQQLFEIGIDKVILGSLPITNPQEFQLITDSHPKDKIIIASDVLNENVLIKGWLENSKVNLFDHVENCIAVGLNTFLVTDVSLDGMLTGPNIELYKKLKEQFGNASIIASGGVSKIEDLIQLREEKLDAAIVGKAIYEGKINLEELSKIAE